MSTQTYCLRADVEAAWTPAGLLAAVDDDASGTISAGEEAIVTRAIERAAIDVYLDQFSLPGPRKAA